MIRWSATGVWLDYGALRLLRRAWERLAQRLDRTPASPRYVSSECPDCRLCRLAAASPADRRPLR